MRAGSIGGRGDQAVGQPTGLFGDERIVEQIEGLRRNDGRGAESGRCVGVGAIEQGEVRVACESLRHEIDAAMGRVVNGLERSVLRPVPLADGWKRMWTGSREVELSAGSEQRVAERFGIEAAAVEAPVVQVVGIVRGVGGEFGRGVLAGQLIGFREHDVAMQRLDGPATGDEAAGEPIEQFAVGGRSATEAEVGRRGDETAAEVPLPDAI